MNLIALQPYLITGLGKEIKNSSSYSNLIVQFPRWMEMWSEKIICKKSDSQGRLTIYSGSRQAGSLGDAVAASLLVNPAGQSCVECPSEESCPDLLVSGDTGGFPALMRTDFDALGGEGVVDSEEMCPDLAWSVETQVDSRTYAYGFTIGRGGSGGQWGELWLGVIWSRWDTCIPALMRTDFDALGVVVVSEESCPVLLLS